MTSYLQSMDCRETVFPNHSRVWSWTQIQWTAWMSTIHSWSKTRKCDQHPTTIYIWIRSCHQRWCRNSHQRCSIKKVLLKISQNSLENACVRVSFLIKLRDWAKFRWLLLYNTKFCIFNLFTKRNCFYKVRTKS